MATIQDTVGRLAIAKENVTMCSKELAQAQQFFFQREHDEREGFREKADPPPLFNIRRAIERLEMAIHDLKVVESRIKDG